MRVTLIVITFILLQTSLMGQVLTGTVLDEEKQPIQDVYILNKTNDQHTHSNEHGNFFIEDIAIGDTLQFFIIGYETKTRVITDLNTPLEIVLSIEILALENIVITTESDPLKIISDINIQENPVNSAQDLLRKVPGLFIGQHAGGGKAEQIFLRGFDLDHGTDINISVDGLPVNMVSHAHGQGYADLHFVIPETIDNIDFGKGLYYEDKGNFTTAGYVRFNTKERLDNSSIKLEAGQFNTYRLMSMFNLIDNESHNAYVASEYLVTDGPFLSPQNFNRINVFGKYTGFVSDKDKIGFTASYFSSNWDASGQIPQRAVDSGLISRFGAIDDTEGGNTSRSNILINYDKTIDENTTLKSSIYLSQYDFELYSNFTFFLEDSINGDQIRQRENRTIYGFNSEYKRTFSIDKWNGNFKGGISLRNDQSKDNELSRTLNRRETLEQIQFGDINETNIGAYLGTSINYKKWTFDPSLRLDFFDFQYNDHLLVEFQTQKETKAILSPKFNLYYNESEELQLYLKTGKGFHSNDTRLVVTETDKETLPAAYGSDLGLNWKPIPNILLNIAYWHLFLEQEFVYVGDAGIVEPSGRTRRQGVELSVRYQPLDWLFWNLDANYTLARAIEELDGQNFIPLAPDFTLVSGINIKHESGIYGGINVRHLANRPANEDNSIVAEGYTITDLNVGYKWKNLGLGIEVENLFNTEWNETQFATESQLSFETESVEEIHFTPGAPFNIKASIQYNF